MLPSRCGGRSATNARILFSWNEKRQRKRLECSMHFLLITKSNCLDICRFNFLICLFCLATLVDYMNSSLLPSSIFLQFSALGICFYCAGTCNILHYEMHIEFLTPSLSALHSGSFLVVANVKGNIATNS